MGRHPLVYEIINRCRLYRLQNCAATESEVDFGDDVILVTSNFSDALSATNREITKLKNKFGSFSDIILFFSDSENFRKKILGRV